MPKLKPQQSVQLSAVTRRQMRELARLWGMPETRHSTAVTRQSVAYAHEKLIGDRKMKSNKVLGRPDSGPAVVEHDGVTEWADCSVCGAHLDGASDAAPDDWDGSCWMCDAPAEKVGLRAR